MSQGAAVAPRRARVLFAAALVVAAAQMVLGARLEHGGDFGVTLAITWLAALALGWQKRSTGVGAVGLVPAGVGPMVAIGSVVAMALEPDYRWFFRLLPLVAGVALAFASAGARLWAIHGRSICALALPLVNSPPKFLHTVLDPVLIPVTTWCAWALNRAMGNRIVADAHLLRMPDNTLDVIGGCSGMWAITRLFVLVALVLALFPTTPRQRVRLVASAVAVGFCVNAVRVAVLAASLFHGNDAGYLYWHQEGGATVFALGSSAVAGIAWWLILRGPSAAASPQRA